MRLPLAAVMLVLVVAACSQSSGDGVAGTTSTEGSAPTTQPSATATGRTASTVEATTTSPPTSTAPAVQATTTEPVDGFSVLVFHRTEGFAHASIPAGVDAIGELGDQHGFETVATDDPAIFTDDGLTGFRVIVFLNTTGDVLDDDQQTAMERFIATGKGFVGVHSAADTEYDWPWYGGLVGAYFARHPAPQSGSVQVVTPEHPAMEGIPATFERVEEWYDFRTLPGPEATLLANVDEASYEGGEMGDPHPIVWAQEYGGGRAFYTGFGHAAEAFTDELTRRMLLNGILWAAGRS